MRWYHIPVFARFSWLNDRKVQSILRKLLPQHVRGRKGYDKLKLLLWLLYRQCMRCTYRDLESMTGIDHTTFIKFRTRLIRHRWFANTFEYMSVVLATRLPVVTAILDSSFVETYSRHDEPGSGYSGYKEKNGFKLHTIIDRTTRLPILQAVSAGNIADITAGEQLVERAPPAYPVTSFAADKGYDSESFVHRIAQKWKGTAVAIPVRRSPNGSVRTRRSRGSERTTRSALYRGRTEIERYFSRKKGVFHLGDEKARGIANFETNCFLTSIMEYLEWIAWWVLFSRLEKPSDGDIGHTSCCSNHERIKKK